MKRPMNMLKSRWLYLIILTGTAMVIWVNAQDNNNVYKIINEKFPLIRNIYTAALFHYVDEIDHEEFFDAAINGKLNTLDPYTVYLVNENKAQLQILTDGNYGGIGTLLHYRDKTVTVGDVPFIGTPAARAGIREGDVILEVDGVVTRDLEFDDTANRIRGKIGTEVSLKIQRAGETKPLIFRLVRERILVEDVRFAGMLNDEVGYILLTRFSSNVGNEVKRHIEALQKQGMKKLIFDLRSNPGGVLGAGIEVADLFLPKGARIVSTKGRSQQSNQTYDSPNPAVFGDGEMVVLVNRFSASASEIVAGAVQDHDRAVVIGDTTYGKGLVQSVFNLPPSKNAQLKMTTAKYYTPSGRCIQKRNYSNWSKDQKIDKITQYKTDAGRAVYGGGGIGPDISVDLPLLTAMSVDMRRKSLFFHFAEEYANTHTKLENNFVIDESILEAYQAFLKEKEYHFSHPIEASLENFSKEVKESGYNPSLLTQIKALEDGLVKTKEEIFQASLEDIKFFLRMELATKFWGAARSTEMGLKYDPVVTRALEVLGDNSQYASVFHK